jgi:hypothetical protein
MRRVCVLAAMIVAYGCCLDYWGEVEERETPTDLLLHDVARSDYVPGDFVAVGVSGTLVRDDRLIDLDTDADLFAICPQGGVAGEGGTLVINNEITWYVVQTPTTKDLVGIARHRHEFIAVGDNVVVGFDPETQNSRIIEQADGRPWGSLNGVFEIDWDRLILLGDDGIAWAADYDVDVRHAKQLDLGVSEDLRAGGAHPDHEHWWIVGDGGVALFENMAGDWVRVQLDTSADFVDFAAGAALTAEGEIWDPARNRLIAEVPWAQGLGYSQSDYDKHDGDPREDPEVYIVGDNGRMAVLDGC